MLAMHRDGLIALPAPQGWQNRPGPIVFGPDTEAPLFTALTTLDGSVAKSGWLVTCLRDLERGVEA